MITVTYKAQEDILYCPSEMLLESQQDEEVLAAFDRAIQVRPNREHPNFARGQEKGEFIREFSSRINSQLCGCCNNGDNDCS
jgi:hypothetical protein